MPPATVTNQTAALGRSGPIGAKPKNFFTAFTNSLSYGQTLLTDRTTDTLPLPPSTHSNPPQPTPTSFNPLQLPSTQTLTTLTTLATLTTLTTFTRLHCLV